MHMGRLKKYVTEEELKDAHRRWAKEYYWQNKEKIDEQARERYRKRVGKALSKVRKTS